MSAPDLSKLDLFIKMMRMTEADDPIALVAVRKANAMLKAEGWDWEKLLKGKVTVIADPFGPSPVMPEPEQRRAPPPPPKPTVRTPAASPPPWPRPAARPTAPIQANNAPTDKVKVNAFPGQCTCCPNFVDTGKGFVVKVKGEQRWKLQCTACNLA